MSFARFALLQMRNEAVVVHWSPAEGGPAFRSLSDGFVALHAAYVGSRWYLGFRYCDRFPFAIRQLVFKRKGTSATNLALNSSISLSLGVEKIALRASGAVASLEVSARRGMPVLAVSVTAFSF